MRIKTQFVLLTLILATACRFASAADAPLGDMSPFKQIADETLKLVEKGDAKGAKTRIKDLETAWDAAEPKLKAVNAASWTTVDKAIDLALKEVRAAHPAADKSSKSLKDLIAKFDAAHKK